MTKYVSDTAAGKSLSAYVILNRKGEHVATVKAHHGNSRCTANVHCHRDGFQHATASGYGYDKFTAALAGLTIDGHRMSDHCGESLKRPKRGYWLESDKIKRGYKLANYSTFECATGKALHPYDWQDMARKALGESADYKTVLRHSRELQIQAANRHEIEGGYRDCHRESGLRYLEALGYRVIQAI